MELHPAWEKMRIHALLSKIIEKKRRPVNHTVERYSVHMSDKDMFQDLHFVFSNIDGFKKLYIKLFEDMSKYGFRTTSSVTGRKHNMLWDIDLYQHTFDIFKQMILLINENPSLKTQKDLFLLLALLHDSGKSHELCKAYGIDLEDKHWIRSANYFKKIVELDRADKNEFGVDDGSFNIIVNTLEESASKNMKERSVYLLALTKAVELIE